MIVVYLILKKFEENFVFQTVFLYFYSLVVVGLQFGEKKPEWELEDKWNRKNNKKQLNVWMTFIDVEVDFVFEIKNYYHYCWVENDVYLGRNEIVE